MWLSDEETIDFYDEFQQREVVYRLVDVVEVDSKTVALLLPDSDETESGYDEDAEVLLLKYEGDELVFIEDPVEFKVITDVIRGMLELSGEDTV